jgi:hypothetical protein
MRKPVKLGRPSHTTVVAYLSLFLVTSGGVAYAAGHLGKNSVGTKQLKKNSVTKAKIKKNAVTTAKIRKNAVTTAKIRKNAVTTAKIRDGAVDGAKIAAGSVGFADLAEGSMLVADATGGPLPATSPGGSTVNLGGRTSFTGQAGRQYLLLATAEAHLADAKNGDFCGVEIDISDNGQSEIEVFVGSDGSTTTTRSVDTDDGGLVPAGGTQNLTATATTSSPACGAGSQVDTVHVSVVQFP